MKPTMRSLAGLEAPKKPTMASLGSLDIPSKKPTLGLFAGLEPAPKKHQPIEEIKIEVIPEPENKPEIQTVIKPEPQGGL